MGGSSRASVEVITECIAYSIYTLTACNVPKSIVYLATPVQLNGFTPCRQVANSISSYYFFFASSLGAESLLFLSLLSFFSLFLASFSGPSMAMMRGHFAAAKRRSLFSRATRTAKL
jgi:hypothetical protein